MIVGRNNGETTQHIYYKELDEIKGIGQVRKKDGNISSFFLYT